MNVTRMSFECHLNVNVPEILLQETPKRKQTIVRDWGDIRYFLKIFFYDKSSYCNGNSCVCPVKTVLQTTCKKFI